MTYDAPPRHVDRWFADFKAVHPYSDADARERANVVAAFHEAYELRTVPPDHPCQPNEEGKIPTFIVTPPPPCQCAHCGTDVPEGQHESDYTVEGSTLTVRVSHCDGCHENDACRMSCAPRGGVS